MARPSVPDGRLDNFVRTCAAADNRVAARRLLPGFGLAVRRDGKRRLGRPVAVTAATASGMDDLGGRALHGLRLADDAHQREPSRAALAELEADLLRARPHHLGVAEIGLSAR